MQNIELWFPFPDISSKQRFYCEGVHDDYEGFRILLKGANPESKMLRLSWENALFYQNRDECYFTFQSEYQGKFDFPHPFYQIIGSNLIERFHQESARAYADWAIKHYSIYTCNDCIDVLSALEPKAEVLGG